MSLCNRLHKTKKELLRDLGSNELNEWMAYSRLEDEEYKERIEKIIELEKSENDSDHKKALNLKALLMNIQG